VGEHHGIYRSGTRCADAVNCEAGLLQKPIQYTPRKCPVGASALKSKIGAPRPRHCSSEFRLFQLHAGVHGPSSKEQAIQRFNGQPFNGRPLAVSEARAREDRGPGGPRPGGGGFGGPRPAGGGFAGPRPSGGFGPPRPFDAGGPAPARSRNFGPDAKPQRGGSAKAKKKDADKPRGPIPLKNTGRSFSLDGDDSLDEPLPDIDDIATSKPHEETEDEE